jgi:phage baseplate assembly protein W
MSDLGGSETLNVGFDRSTGATLFGWQAVSQDIREGLVTDFGTRIVREYFGCLVPRALGRNMTPDTILSLTSSVAAFLDVYEPRFKVTRAQPVSLTRLGALMIEIEGEYRPRALLGDETGTGRKKVVVQLANGEVEVAA